MTSGAVVAVEGSSARRRFGICTVLHSARLGSVWDVLVLRTRRPPIASETPIVQTRKPRIRIVFRLCEKGSRRRGNPWQLARHVVKKTDKDMTDQELGMMYQKAAHATRTYLYNWVLTDPSPNNIHHQKPCAEDKKFCGMQCKASQTMHVQVPKNSLSTQSRSHTSPTSTPTRLLALKFGLARCDSLGVTVELVHVHL